MLDKKITPVVLDATALAAAVAFNRGRLKGQHARDLQTMLGVVADGDFGPASTRAVVAFQQRRGLAPIDGKCGEDTEKALREQGADAEQPDKAETPSAGIAHMDAGEIATAKRHFANIKPLSVADVRKAQRVIDETPDGKWGAASIQALAAFQAQHNLDPNGCLNTSTISALKADPDWAKDPLSTRDLTREEQDAVIEFTKIFEARKGTPAQIYSSSNENSEHYGSFDFPKKDAQGNKIPRGERSKHPGFKPHGASMYHPTGGYMIGLSYGAWQGTQEHGTLCEMLLWMRHIDTALFDQCMGGPANSKRVLKMLSLDGKGGLGSGVVRSPRVQPIDGADLWEQPWLGRIQALAEHEVFRSAQRDIIVSEYLVPVTADALRFGFRDNASLVVLFDISIQCGAGGAEKYLTKGVAKAPAWSPTPEQPFRPQSHIEHVIEALPDHLESRRDNILRMANPFVIYTPESMRAIQPRVTKDQLRALRQVALRA